MFFILYCQSQKPLLHCCSTIQKKNKSNNYSSWIVHWTKKWLHYLPQKELKDTEKKTRIGFKKWMPCEKDICVLQWRLPAQTSKNIVGRKLSPTIHHQLRHHLRHHLRRILLIDPQRSGRLKGWKGTARSRQTEGCCQEPCTEVPNQDSSSERNGWETQTREKEKWTWWSRTWLVGRIHQQTRYNLHDTREERPGVHRKGGWWKGVQTKKILSLDLKWASWDCKRHLCSFKYWQLFCRRIWSKTVFPSIVWPCQATQRARLQQEHSSCNMPLWDLWKCGILLESCKPMSTKRIVFAFKSTRHCGKVFVRLSKSDLHDIWLQWLQPARWAWRNGEMGEGDFQTDTFLFTEWKKVDEKIQKAASSVETEEVITLLMSHIKTLKSHIHVKRIQHAKFHALKANLHDDDLLIQVDYSESYANQEEGQIQSVYFGQQTFSIFTACCYLNIDGEIVNENVTITSEASDHSMIAALSCWLRIVSFLQEKYNLSKSLMLYMWSDGCAGQFRSRFVFKLLAEFAKEHTIAWYYNERHHGKGPMEKDPWMALVELSNTVFFVMCGLRRWISLTRSILHLTLMEFWKESNHCTWPSLRCWTSQMTWTLLQRSVAPCKFTKSFVPLTKMVSANLIFKKQQQMNHHSIHSGIEKMVTQMFVAIQSYL